MFDEMDLHSPPHPFVGRFLGFSNQNFERGWGGKMAKEKHEWSRLGGILIIAYAENFVVFVIWIVVLSILNSKQSLLIVGFLYET